MKKTRDLKVKKKLKKGFFRAISIASIAGIAGAIFLFAIDARYGKALELNGFIQGDLGEYNTYLNKGSAYVRDIITLTDKAEIELAKEDLKHADEKMAQYYDEFSHKLESAKEKELLATIDEKLPLYVTARDEAIVLADAGKDAQAMKMFREEARPHLQEVMGAVDALIAMNVEMGDKVSDSLTLYSDILVVAIIVMVLIAGFIGTRFAEKTAKEIEKSLHKVQKAAKKLASGELDVQVDITSKDEFGEMAEDFNNAAEQLKLYVDTVRFGLEEVGAGNFAVQPPIEFHGDFVALKDAIIHITQSLSSTMREINDGSEQVALGAEQLALNAQTLAEGATTQAAAIEELTATIENVTAAAETNATQADYAYKKAEDYAAIAQQSSEEMEMLTQAMERITETSREIETIIGEIEDIAAQTNLLSLNASIEAARAGEAGRGFAVVADQIGKLAADSAQSAVNTKELILKSLQEIDSGNEITAKTASALQEVMQGIKELALASRDSRETSADQAATMEQVQQGILQITDVVQSNSASAEETSATSEELSAQSENLKAMVDQFRLLEE